jgi:5-formyltetrahydrofolate cyclo-ligase
MLTISKPMTQHDTSPSDQKRYLRTEALARRDSQPDKDALSRTIGERLLSLPAYQQAKTVLFYVDVRSEVRTRWVLPRVLESGNCLVVPYCVGRELALFHLRNVSELVPGRFGILEPDPVLRGDPHRRVGADQLDLLIVPGVAFDQFGGRMGHGHGFYDRLLAKIRPGIPKIGLAFECQIVPAVPTEPHDVPLDAVITETAVSPASISPR